MGLLDDAIREHMELRRLRGADPSQVAREEQDVLGRVPRRGDPKEPEVEVEDIDQSVAIAENQPGTDTENQRGIGTNVADQPGKATADQPAEGEDAQEHPQPARGADFANVGQETAELDMRTVLDEQHEAADRAGQIDSAGLGAAPGEEPAPVEDVLEETPDFLRDTPEQERLWFEQQPPRDFDFDK